MWKFATRPIASGGVILIAGVCALGAPRAGAQEPPGGARPGATGQPLVITTPLKDGAAYLGDVQLTIGPGDTISLSSRTLATLAGPLVSDAVLQALERLAAERSTITPDDVASTGIGLVYDPSRIELQLRIRPDQRATRQISIVPNLVEPSGPFERPADISGYLTARAAFDFVTVSEPVERDFTTTTVFFDGALRWSPLVLESQASLQTNSVTPDFQRIGTRLIYDDVERVFRVTVGDLRSLGQSFQTFPEIAGVSIARVYSVLQPTRIAQPGGDRQFRLVSPSTVDIMVNGRLTRTVRLDPGSYDLRDFPFTEGANEVRLIVKDDTGRREALAFTMFYDRAQLAKGLSEFGVYAGVAAPLVNGTPEYTDRWTYSGWYRRGVTDSLTLGVNSQGDDRSNMSGVEATWGSPIGIVSIEGAASWLDAAGWGTAARLTFTRNMGSAGSFNAFLETRSDEFAVVGDVAPDNPFQHEIGLGWSRTLSENFYASLDLRYGKGRGLNPDRQIYRVSLGYQFNERTSLDFDVGYSDEPGFEGFSALLSLNVRLGEHGNGRAEYDTRFERARLDYRAYGGQDVGAWNVNADTEVGPDFSYLNGDASYTTNRAELGISASGAWGTTYRDFSASRTSLRAAGSIAFAGDAWAIGRPIHDSFAIFVPHRTMKDAAVVVQPMPDGYEARSGGLGPALATDLSAYSEQLLAIDTPGAEAGYDIGAGAYRLYPPYRGGYRIGVGSDYYLTAFGVLLDETGEPLVLVSGTATDLTAPDREPVIIFTNRQGRFAASGLREGRWRLDMNTSPPTSYSLNIRPGDDAIVTLEPLRPSGPPP